MHGYWTVGKWKAIPVFFHWTILFWALWCWILHRNLLGTTLTFLAFVALLLVHEMGHAVAAHVNRVPVYSIKLSMLHGQCEHQQAHYEAEDLLISWGGVLAQLALLALALTTKFVLTLSAPAFLHFLAPLFYVFIDVNMLLIAFNLIPVAPLDGSRAWRVVPYFCPIFLAWTRQRIRVVGRMLNLKERKAARRASEEAATELMDRLMKNKD